MQEKPSVKIELLKMVAPDHVSDVSDVRRVAFFGSCRTGNNKLLHRQQQAVALATTSCDSLGVTVERGSAFPTAYCISQFWGLHCSFLRCFIGHGWRAQAAGTNGKEGGEGRALTQKLADAICIRSMNDASHVQRASGSAYSGEKAGEI